MTAATLVDYGDLPRGAQLLLAYSLYNDLDVIPLMKKDPDGKALVSGGWLEEKPCKILGVSNFEFSEPAFKRLMEISDHILKSVSEEELEHYKDRKKATYPWLW